jgi:hypothetical protein
VIVLLFFGDLETYGVFGSHQASGNTQVTDSDPIDSGVTVWDSALVMAYFLCKNPEEIQSKLENGLILKSDQNLSFLC